MHVRIVIQCYFISEQRQKVKCPINDNSFRTSQEFAAFRSEMEGNNHFQSHKPRFGKLIKVQLR